MSLLSIFGCGRAKTPEYPADRLSARDGTEFTITFFKHASLAISVGGKYIYVDPVSANADYGALPKADVVLITHSHYDHLDVAAVEKLLAADTEILCDRTSAEAFEMNCYTMRPGSVATPRDYVKVEAVAAYNTTPGHLQFHPREREDCGYVLTIGGTRIYIAGDTEPNHELKKDRHRLSAREPALHDDRRPGRRSGESAETGDLLPLPLRRGGRKDRHRPSGPRVGGRDGGPHPADGIAGTPLQNKERPGGTLFSQRSSRPTSCGRERAPR